MSQVSSPSLLLWTLSRSNLEELKLLGYRVLFHPAVPLNLLFSLKRCSGLCLSNHTPTFLGSCTRCLCCEALLCLECLSTSPIVLCILTLVHSFSSGPLLASYLSLRLCTQFLTVCAGRDLVPWFFDISLSLKNKPDWLPCAPREDLLFWRWG